MNLFAIRLLPLAIVLGLLLPSSAGAYILGTGDDTLNAGGMNCDTGVLPATRDGQVSGEDQRLLVVFVNEGHVQLTAGVQGFGTLQCSYAIVITNVQYSGGINPSGTLTNEVDGPACNPTNGATCVVTKDFDWTIDFLGVHGNIPHATDHMVISYELRVQRPTDLAAGMVASGDITIWEPSVPEL